MLDIYGEIHQQLRISMMISMVISVGDLCWFFNATSPHLLGVGPAICGDHWDTLDHDLNAGSARVIAFNFFQEIHVLRRISLLLLIIISSILTISIISTTSFSGLTWFSMVFFGFCEGLYMTLWLSYHLYQHPSSWSSLGNQTCPVGNRSIGNGPWCLTATRIFSVPKLRTSVAAVIGKKSVDFLRSHDETNSLKMNLKMNSEFGWVRHVSPTICLLVPLASTFPNCGQFRDLKRSAQLGSLGAQQRYTGRALVWPSEPPETINPLASRGCWYPKVPSGNLT